MKQRLLNTLPIASLVGTLLFLLAPSALLAQRSSRADSVRSSSSTERGDRGRSSSREVRSARTRDASRSPSSAQPDERRDDRRPDVVLRSGRGEGRDIDRRPDREDDARRDRDDDRRGDRDDDRRGDRDDDRRGDRDDDRRRDRDDDRRWERDDDRRRDRDEDWRDDRNRRRDGGPIILNRLPHGQGWVRPRIFIDVNWPWVHRHERRWSPRYRYRQVVYVDAGWSGSRRESRLDLRTFYRHRVREASPNRAVVDIQIDRIEIYEDGFFVGEVRTIPDELANMRAVVDRRHGVRFDRDVFLVGDPYAGFEIISTRHYDGFVLNRYRASHGVRAGALDLRRERVVPVRRSRFFDPRDFAGFVPINLLPEEAGWLVDYGYDSYSGHYWGDDDRFYYGFSETDDYSRRSDDRAVYNQIDPRDVTTGRETTSSRLTPERQPLERSMDQTFDTDAGATIRLKRESWIERID